MQLAVQLATQLVLQLAAQLAVQLALESRWKMQFCHVGKLPAPLPARTAANFCLRDQQVATASRSGSMYTACYRMVFTQKLCRVGMFEPIPEIETCEKF